MESHPSSNNRGKWREVAPSNPCPICKHTSWCRVSEDGVFCACRRSGELGGGTKKTDKNGEDYWLHRLIARNNGDGKKWAEPKHALADGKGELADIDTRDNVYKRFLNRLPLSSAHKEQLTRRGIKNGHRAANFATLGKARAKAAYALVEAGLEERLPHVPGFYVQEKDGRRFWSVAGFGGLCIPVRDVQGRIQTVAVRVDDDSTGGRYRYLSSSRKGGLKSPTPVHVPLCLKDTDKSTVRVTEGFLKADAATRLSGMLTIGLPGVSAWRRAGRILRELGTKTVRVAYDADACHNRNVAECLSHLVNHLRRHGFAVELEIWDEAEGKGIDDLLAAGKQPDVVTGEEVVDSVVKRIVDDARKADPPPSGPGCSVNGFVRSGLPPIQFNKRQLRDVTDDALNAILAANKPPRLFQRGNLLVRVRTTQDTQAVSLEPMVVTALRGHLARVADWFREKVTGKGETYLEPDAPPVEVAADVANLPSWPGVPGLRAIIECPAFGCDGSLVDQPGYHEGSQLWYEPAPGLSPPPIPTNPTTAEIEAARHLLLVELLGDFPFDDEASKANILAALLVSFVRQMIDGPVPLHLLDAPVEGTGKTLLGNCIGLVATGRDLEAMAEGKDDDEWRKRIIATLVEAPAFVFLDNISRLLDSGALASALTARVVKDRILGISKTATVPNSAVWIASGNNCRLSRELVRRTVWTRLNAKLENPWERTKFRHPNLRLWVKERRSELVGAALTLCQAWIAAGRPAGKQTLGMFESWVSTMGGILDVAGVPGLLANAKKFRQQAADKASEWLAFVTAWYAKYMSEDVGVKDLYDLAVAEKLLDSVLGDGEERSQRTRLGIQLGKARDRVIGCYRICAAEQDNSSRQMYHLTLTVGQQTGPAPAPPAPAANDDEIVMEG